MNGFLLAASALAAVVGLVHTMLGEHLIFRRLRKGGVVPTFGGELLAERHVRILWATWHLATLFGWSIAGLFWWLALPTSRPVVQSPAPWILAAAMFGASVLVLVATRARHPGWVGLLLVALLAAIGSRG
jgi:hypothetical protein